MNDDSIAHYYDGCYDYYWRYGLFRNGKFFPKMTTINNDKDANNNLTTDFYFGGHIITL